MSNTKRIRAMLLLFLIFGVLSCSTVAPWERGRLAKPHMALVPFPEQGLLREHNYNSREAASGGGASSGGGCGCY